MRTFCPHEVVGYSVPVRRFIIRSALRALLGFLTTIAIAWACAAFVPLPTGPPREDVVAHADGTTEWRIEQRAFGRSRINYVRGSTDAMGGANEQGNGLIVPLLDAFSILRPDDAGSLERSGWPLHAFSCRSNQLAIASDTMSFTITMDETDLVGGILVASSTTTQPWRALPFQPKWCGMVLDWLIYTGAWMAIFLGLPQLRAWLRRTRGRCPRCGYDLRGQLSSGCPECGWNRANHPVTQ